MADDQPRGLARLLAWDAALSRRLALPPGPGQKEERLYWPALVGAHLGDSWLWALLTLWLWREAGQRPATDGLAQRRRLQGWIASQLGVYVLTLAIKPLVRRARPNRGTLLYGPGPDQHSFPSGHAARMGVLVVWLPHLLPGWGGAAWLLALWVSSSRVAMGVHYVGDVIAGFGLGAALSGLLRRR